MSNLIQEKPPVDEDLIISNHLTFLNILIHKKYTCNNLLVPCTSKF